MPHTILRASHETRILAHLDAIAGHIGHCEDLSELVLFIADAAGREDGAALVSDPDACARAWRGVAAVHEQLQESLAHVRTAAEQLEEAIRTPGVR